MAEVYRSIKGKPFADWLAHTKMVDVALRMHATARAGRAASYLAAHRDQGHSFIEVEKKKLDYWVQLNDERGLFGAMSIEFGRRSNDEGKNGMPGLFILHRAFDIPHRGR